MKKKINGKTYNTETSRKVCGYVVNDWTYELYQSRTGEYFSYIYNEDYISYWMKNNEIKKILKREDVTKETLRLLTESEVKHMLERSGSDDQDRKETVLTELIYDLSQDGNIPLNVTGKCGIVNIDFGSWELTVDIDDKHRVKVMTKGKIIFEEDNLDEIEWIRNRWDMVRYEYLKERFGEC